MSKPIRFQYGGHATFPVRYGWLSKGIDRLMRDGMFIPNTDTADELGLGSKMVKSLSYWLDVTGLSGLREATHAPIKPSNIASIIKRWDPYFEYPGTWWFLHIALVRREGTIWSWFFNEYSDRIFDRLACIEAFLQYTRSNAFRPASTAVAQREVACLLGAYASRPGVDVVDPNDIGACPLRELGLIFRLQAVNRFERVRNPRGVPIEAFLACASMLAAEQEKTALSIRELASAYRGPGRILCLGLDAIEKMIDNVGTERWDEGIGAETSAGERHLVIAPHKLDYWLEELYCRIAGASV